MNIDTAVAIPSHVIARQVGEESVLLDLASGTYFGLNPVGSRVWTLLAAGHTPAQACQQLAAEFDATLPQLHTDVLALLDHLQSKGLIHASAG